MGDAACKWCGRKGHGASTDPRCADVCYDSVTCRDDLMAQREAALRVLRMWDRCDLGYAVNTPRGELIAAMDSMRAALRALTDTGRKSDG